LLCLLAVTLVVCELWEGRQGSPLRPGPEEFILEHRVQIGP